MVDFEREALMRAVSNRPDPEIAADPMTLLLQRLERIEEAVGQIISAINRPSLMRMPEVERRTGLKKSALYAQIKNKKFPAPVRMGELTGFVESEVESWIEARIRERDQGHSAPSRTRRLGVGLGVDAGSTE
jgi:prophage regulatory protein